MSSFFTELKRRNVFRVGVAYIIIAWILIEAADLLLGNFGAPEWVVKAFTIVVFLGLPLAVFFAWAFELTPDGLKRETEVDRSQSITPRTGRKLDFAIIALLAVALTYFVVTHDWRDDTRTVDEGQSTKTIAVIPFVNMSDDPANEYFSDGIAEELLNLLVKVEDLRVASRTSSFSFKGKDVDVPTIARSLNVDHILEGSVRKSGNRVRVTAQLVEVESDSHLWSETYERELEDIFAVQKDISTSIVNALKIELGTAGQQALDPNRQPTDSMAAYQAYLQGRYLMARRGDANLRGSMERFQEAIALDPGFAVAHANLAAANYLITNYSSAKISEYGPLATQTAKQALKLDDSLGMPWAVLAMVQRSQGNWAESERLMNKALEAEPDNSTIRFWRASQLAILGRTRVAYEELIELQRLDPLAGIVNGWLGYVSGGLGQHDEAVLYARTAIETGWIWADAELVRILLHRGDYEEARRVWEQRLTDEGYDPSLVKYVVDARRDSSRLPDAMSAISNAREAGKSRTVHFMAAYRYLGQTEQMIEMLEQLVAEGLMSPLVFLWNESDSQIRQDPRFAELISKAGFLDYWAAHGWPDLCRPDGDSFTCE